MPAKPIPEGYHTLNPHLAVDDAAQAIEFYKRAFAPRNEGVYRRPTERSRTPSSRSEIRS